MKECNHCGQLRPLTEFRNGAKCKDCERAYDRVRYKSRREYIASFRGVSAKLYRKKCPVTGTYFTTTNPSRIYSDEAVRQIRAKKQFASPTQREIIIARYHGKCAICGTATTNDTHKATSAHIDHVVPIPLGGTNHLSNMQLLCALCNHRKRVNDYHQGVGKSQVTVSPEIAGQPKNPARNV